MTANPSQQVLNRIAIGNHLISTAGSLTPNADPLSVAQAILLAHDASELVLAGLAALIGGKRPSNAPVGRMESVLKCRHERRTAGGGREATDAI